MKNLFFKISFFTLLFLSTNLRATEPRVFGFLGDWHNNFYYTESGVQYEYMTDVVYSFILPQSNGSFAFDVGSTAFYSRLTNVVTHAHNKGVKVHVSAGGWGSSNGQQGVVDPIHNMVNNETARNTFITNVLNMIKTYDLDGFNMDWEYPLNSDGYVLGELLLDLKIGMSDLESEMGKSLELSIAVAAGSHGSGAYDITSLSICDLVMIMAFDNAASHHSTTTFATGAMDYWINSKGISDYQLVLGVPFYSRGTGVTGGAYRNFSSSDPEGYYMDSDGIKGNYAYNSRPVLEEKLAAVKARDGVGVFVWEITDDRTDQYSLLKVLYENLVSNAVEISELTGVSFYPNPVEDELVFEIDDNTLTTSTLEFNVTDITGKLVQKGYLESTNTRINVSSIVNPGVYFLMVKNDQNKSVVFKLIKK